MLLVPLLLLAASPVLAQGSLEEARALHGAGRLEEALELYRQVARERAGTAPAEAGTALNNACVILLGRGEYEGARELCLEALELRRQVGEPRALARTWNNLGLAAQYLGRYRRAAGYYQSALEVYRRLGDVASAAGTLDNQGLLAALRGRYGEALQRHLQAERLALAGHGEAWAREQLAVSRLNRGVVLEKMGAYREALELYQELLAGSDALDARQLAALRINTATLHRNLGRPERALELLRQVIGELDEGDRALLANAWLNVGLVEHLNLGRLAAAEASLRRALALARASGDRFEIVQDLFYLGRLLLDRGRLAEAGETFRSSLEMAVEAGSAEGRWSALEGLARVAEAQGDLEAARSRLAAAMGIIEEVRRRVPGHRYRAGYFGDKRTVYATAVRVLWGLHRRSGDPAFGVEALEVVQRAKVRELLERLGGGDEAGAPLTREALRGLPGADLLLEYFLGEERLYAWVVSRGGIRMAALASRREVERRVLELHAALARGEEPPGEARERLGKDLLGWLPGLVVDPGEGLVVATDGLLAYVPFGFLPDPWEVSRPLVAARPVAYLPSLSSLPSLDRRQGGLAYGFAGFGGIGPPEADAGLPLMDLMLSPLAGSEAELRQAASRLRGPTTLRLGPEATEEAFRAVGREGSRVLHLATHTVLREGEGGEAAVLLSPGAGGDGLLYPQEIAAMALRTDLSVLAACRTALARGEGPSALATLTGAFLAAGSSAVVATLWDVGDRATAAFMEQFYHHLGAGRPPSEALRRAKLRLLRDPGWGRPGLWAAYVLVGRDRPVAEPSWSSPARLAPLAGGALLLALVALWLVRRQLSR